MDLQVAKLNRQERLCFRVEVWSGDKKLVFFIMWVAFRAEILNEIT